MTTVDKATSNSTMKNHQPQHCDVHLRQPCCVDCVSGASPNAQVAEPEKNEKEKKRNCFRHRGYITFLSNEGSSHLRHTRSRDVRGNAYTIGMFVDIVRWLFSFRFPNPKKKRQLVLSSILLCQAWQASNARGCKKDWPSANVKSPTAPAVPYHGFQCRV